MDPISAEKHTAMLRYRRLHKLTTLFRCLEALAAFLLLLWSSARLPSAARTSADFLLRLAAVLLGPRFLFLLGNAIVLLLFFRSRRLSSTSSSISDDLDRHLAISSFLPPPPTPTPPEAASAEVVVYEDKAVCVEIARPKCERSRSERIDRRREAAAAPELRRSETEVGKRSEEDAEEFRRTIEAFIEKQLKFQRRESMAIVSADGGCGLSCSAGTTEPMEKGV